VSVGKRGGTYRVQWREGGRHRSRSFERKRDAVDFEATIRLRKRRGELSDIDAGRQTLAAFYTEWLERYARPNLAPATLAYYERAWRVHIAPELGAFELRQLTTEAVETFAADLRRRSIGAETIRKVLVLLQGILRRAVAWSRIGSNPVSIVAKPRRRRQREITALAPSEVESLRSATWTDERDRPKAMTKQDATIVSVLAYAGLRPSEALALTWADVGPQALRVNKSIAGDTKTGRQRSVRLLEPLRADLREWQLSRGVPEPSAPVFPLSDGRPFTVNAFRNWRKRTFTPAAKAAGLEGLRPYDLRHSFASLQFAEGINPAEIAGQLGHSLAMLLSTYTHVIENLRGRPSASAETLIRQARPRARVGRM
jgi:integrase